MELSSKGDNMMDKQFVVRYEDDEESEHSEIVPTYEEALEKKQELEEAGYFNVSIINERI